jgi:hypothetical protein
MQTQTNFETTGRAAANIKWNSILLLMRYTKFTKDFLTVQWNDNQSTCRLCHSTCFYHLLITSTAAEQGLICKEAKTRIIC